MPIHDSDARVDAGIYHDFHHEWISTIRRALNQNLLPSDYYALAEQFAAGFGPDVLTLQSQDSTGNDVDVSNDPVPSGLLVAPPKAKLVGETDMEFYRRKQNRVAVRHSSGDRLVAVIEILSPGNKNNRHGIRSFLEKASEFLDQGIHLLVIDPFPPSKRDPHGIHWAIWSSITGIESESGPMKPLVLASYEAAAQVRAYVEEVAVGDSLPEMPLFLEAGAHIDVPLEPTYEAAFTAVPRRWRKVLE